MKKTAYQDLESSLSSLIQIIEEINGDDFDVCEHPRTQFLIKNHELLLKNNSSASLKVASDLMSGITRWYDGGFKKHTVEENRKQRSAVEKIYNQAAKYLIVCGSNEQK